MNLDCPICGLGAGRFCSDDCRRACVRLATSGAASRTYAAPPAQEGALERAAKAIDAEAEKCREVGVRIADGPRSGHWKALGNTAALRAYERAAAIVRGSKGQS
jgi:hypothetical protein